MNSARKGYLAALCLLAVCSLFFAVHGYRNERHALHSRDFKPIYGGARCLLAGCNPYNLDQDREQFLKAGGLQEDFMPFRAYNATYPPGMIGLMTPIAALPWNVANAVWKGLIAISMISAVFLLARLCAPYAPFAAIACLSLSMATSTLLIMLGQPAGVAIGLGILGACCLLSRHYEWAGVLCFALSLALKPQIGAFVWLYFFLATPHYRKRALQIAGITVLLCIPGTIWASLMPASQHWPHDLNTDIAYNFARGNPADAGPSDPDALLFTNLQGIVSLFRDDPHVYNPVTWLIMAPIMLAWIWLAWRLKPSMAKDLLALASIACLTLLPVYHRNYDARLFLLSIPALSVLLYRRRLASSASFASIASIASIVPYAALALTVAIILMTSAAYTHYLQTHILAHPQTDSLLKTLLIGRTTTLALLALGLLYLFEMYQLRNAPSEPQRS